MSNNILKDADEIVHGARNAAYGHPLENHGLTAMYWNVYLSGITGKSVMGPLSAEDICFLNILQKIARSQNNVDLNRDSLVDIAGYAANVEMIMEKRKEVYGHRGQGGG